MILSLIPDSGKSGLGMGPGMDPRSPVNREWWWGWTPDPRQIGGGTPIPIPGKSGIGTRMGMGIGGSESVPWDSLSVHSKFRSGRVRETRTVRFHGLPWVRDRTLTWRSTAGALSQMSGYAALCGRGPGGNVDCS